MDLQNAGSTFCFVSLYLQLSPFTSCQLRDRKGIVHNPFKFTQQQVRQQERYDMKKIIILNVSFYYRQNYNLIIKFLYFQLFKNVKVLSRLNPSTSKTMTLKGLSFWLLVLHFENYLSYRI